MILTYEGKTPKIAANVFICTHRRHHRRGGHPGSASIWYGPSCAATSPPLRSDATPTSRTTARFHTDHGYPTVIGAGVTIGHNAVIHGCVIEDDCMISIAAAVLSRAVIRRGAVVAAGTVVKEGQEIGPGQLAAEYRPLPNGG